MILPCPALQPYIKWYIIDEVSEERTYNVLPDTGLVIGFQYKGKLSLVSDLGETPLAASGISGLADGYKIFKGSAGIKTILVFFREGGAANFFDAPLHQLFRESVSLDNFMLRSELLLVEEQLAEAVSAAARISIVEKFLLSRLTSKEPDKLVLSALARIHSAKGIIRISELAAQLNTSQGPLEKRFRMSVGTSPKKFAAIVRMKHLINAYLPGASLAGLGYEGGFYDQAHFIREFNRFTGNAPGDFFK